MAATINTVTADKKHVRIDGNACRPRSRFVGSTLPSSAVRVEDLCEPWMKPMLRWQYGLWMTSDVPQAGEVFLAADDAGKRSPSFLREELEGRLRTGPVAFRLLLHLAEAGDPTDDVTAL